MITKEQLRPTYSCKLKLTQLLESRVFIQFLFIFNVLTSQDHCVAFSVNKTIDLRFQNQKTSHAHQVINTRKEIE